MNMIQFDAKALLALSTILLIIIAFRPLIRKVKSALEHRQQLISKQLSEAESLRIEAEQLLANYQRKHQEAVEEARRMLEDAEEQVRILAAKAEKDIEETIQRRMRAASERIEIKEKQVIEAAYSQAITLAVKVTEQVISQQMDSSAHQQFIKAMVQNIQNDMQRL
jgi:F-type H+-transporting ATPase subunit b